MKHGLDQIVPNVVVGVWLAMGFLIVQPVSAEEKAAVSAPPVSTSESVAVSAPMVKGGLPADDPTAAVWGSATLARFPMSPQVHWPTRILDVTVKDLNVRALHDGTNVAILLEYADVDSQFPRIPNGLLKRKQPELLAVSTSHTPSSSMENDEDLLLITIIAHQENYFKVFLTFDFICPCLKNLLPFISHPRQYA